MGTLLMIWHDQFDWAMGIGDHVHAELTQYENCWQVDVRFAGCRQGLRCYTDSFDEAKREAVRLAERAN